MTIQCLFRIDICSKSVNADDLAQVLNQYLSVDYGVKANSLLMAMRDGASVNQAALDRIVFIFPRMLNVVCFSHVLDNVGNHLVIPTLLEFGSIWIHQFHHSYKATLLWKDLTGKRPTSYSEMRWWSKWEVYQQILMQFADIERFLIEAEVTNVGPQLLPQLQAIFSASAVKKVLLVQPSLVAAERVFSILNSSFNDQQEHTLVDYLQASVMTQYNKQ